jgi:putative tryptophan/tyrosine transport system substrate-binding protein
MHQLKRRELITLLAGASAWPFAARAQQQAGKVPTIGYLGPNVEPVDRPRIAAFAQRIGELGWTEGRSVIIERRAADGLIERASEIAIEFVRLKVNVLLTSGDACGLAAKRATTVIPIVIAIIGDPVGSGLVASLARPGGNVTGLSFVQGDTAGKRLELLREVVPGLRRPAILANLANPGTALDFEAAQVAAHALSMEPVKLAIQRGQDIPAAIGSLNGRADALYVCADAIVNSNRVRINTLALEARLPVMHSFRDNVEAGGLVSYGPDILGMYQHAADLVDKILRGAKPADIPVEQPTKFALVINLKTAKALGLTIPESLLARADAVIE